MKSFALAIAAALSMAAGSAQATDICALGGCTQIVSAPIQVQTFAVPQIIQQQIQVPVQTFSFPQVIQQQVQVPVVVQQQVPVVVQQKFRSCGRSANVSVSTAGARSVFFRSGGLFNRTVLRVR